MLSFLERNDWKIAAVARLLGVTRRTVYLRLRSFGIERKHVPKIYKKMPVDGMSELQVALSHAVKLALVAVLAGLVARGRARLCWSFAAYLAAILVGNSVASLWPAALLHRGRSGCSSRRSTTP